MERPVTVAALERPRHGVAFPHVSREELIGRKLCKILKGDHQRPRGDRRVLVPLVGGSIAVIQLVHPLIGMESSAIGVGHGPNREQRAPRAVHLDLREGDSIHITDRSASHLGKGEAVGVTVLTRGLCGCGYVRSSPRQADDAVAGLACCRWRRVTTICDVFPPAAVRPAVDAPGTRIFAPEIITIFSGDQLICGGASGDLTARSTTRTQSNRGKMLAGDSVK